MGDADVIQLGSRGAAGRGSKSRPSTAARNLAPGGRRSTRAATPDPATPDPLEPEPVEPQPVPGPEDEAIGPEPVIDPEYARSGRDPDADPAGDTPPDSSVPPTVNASALIAELADAFAAVVERLRGLSVEDLGRAAGDPLRGLLGLAARLGVDWDGSLDSVAAFIRSRLSGDYAVDEFGFDPEFTRRVYLPLLRPLADSWFRVEVRGAENLPTDGAALLVSNHAGTLPLDGMVLQTVVYDEIARHVRMLGADLIFASPYSGDLARKTGTTLACQEDAERLLAAGHLVAVYPEGFKGLGKPYAERYKLQRFGRGGFVSAAVRASVPIVPVSVVGSEEIYPLLFSAPTLARALGFPYFPVTPTFPWLGLLGLVPLPSKWIIQFGEAITTDELPAGAADDPMVVFNITDQVRETIQQTLYSLLVQRRSAFL